MSQARFNSLDLDKLKTMYADLTSKLYDAILNADSWELVKEYRYELIDLEIALYNKVRFGKMQRHNRITEELR